MKNITLLLFIFVIGCNSNYSETKNDLSPISPVLEEREIEEIVEASTKKGRSFDFKQYNNILEELWSAYLEKDDSLNQIIQQFYQVLTINQKENEKLQDYQEVNNSYYGLSVSESQNMNDSIKSIPLLNQLKQSKQSFEKSLSHIKEANHEIDNIHGQILDEIRRIKVEKTLLLVEQYQEQNKIPPETFEKIKENLSVVLKDLKQN